MLRRTLLWVAMHMPPALLSRIRRLSYQVPWLRRAVVAPLARVARVLDTQIRHGPATGLRFNPAGSGLEYALGTCEPAIQEALERLLEPGQVMYDIGANVGFFSLLGARLVGPRGHVYAFEPVPDNAEAIRRNVALNGFENVEVIERAVSAAAGRAEFVLAREPTQGKLKTLGDPTKPAGLIEVDLVAVDDLVSGGMVEPPTLVKIDVEGAELEVIEGMDETLRAKRPLVLCELHGTNREFAERMRALGYTISVLDQSGAVEDAHWNVHTICTP